jgi:hypothetical protein
MLVIDANSNESEHAMTRLRMIGRRVLAGLVAGMLAVGAIGFARPASASASARMVYATQTSTSSNWAGYVAGGNTFSSVSGGWTVPTAKSDTDGYSATWIGLGGASSSSSSLEQVGTESDYVDGRTTYTAWYELVPEAPVTLKLSVHAGDRMTAKVAVSGTTVTISITDQTTGRTVTRTLHMSDPDSSSAEWVAEAPTVEYSNGASEVVPLADFGKVSFTSASATSTAGHTGAIADPAWSTEKVDLVSSSSGGPGGGRFAAASSGAQATTSSLKSGGSAFSVKWTAGEDASPGYGGYPQGPMI